MLNLNEFAREVHENAVAHGWWDDDREIGEIIALIHSEWSEALEEYRADRPIVWHKCAAPIDLGSICMKNYGVCDETKCKYEPHRNCMDPKPEGIAVELIDGCIRILDYLGKTNCAFSDWDTLDNMMAVAYEQLYKFELPHLVAELHERTSSAYRILKIAHLDERERSVGCSILATCAVIACCWVSDQGLDPEALLREKHAYNKTRPYKHGGKRI